MPFQIVDPETDTVGPFNRLSSSQVNTWNACKRMWFYQKRLRFKIGQIPKLFLGRAVEETFCRVILESPGLIVSQSPWDVYAKGAEQLLLLNKNIHAMKPEELKDWAYARAEIHWSIIFDKMRLLWEKSERKMGEWSDIDSDIGLQMCRHGLDFHIEEVLRCYSEISDYDLNTWRSGKHHIIPAPDGRKNRPSPHPLAWEGNCSLIEAWEIARPWFVDPDAPAFSMNAIHPEYWFQGEYDLVYRWDGNIRIVDLKASIGSGDRSGDYVLQLEMYAMLWWVTHQKKEMVDSLEVWYLGVPSIKSVEVPSQKKLELIEQNCKNLWDEIRNKTPELEDCPPMPSELRGFAKGGIPTDPPSEKRCDYCEWSTICPSGDGDDNFPMIEKYKPLGNVHEFNLTGLSELNPRVNIFAEVFSISPSTQALRPQMSIIEGQNYATIRFMVDADETVSDLRKGDTIRLVDVIPTVNHRGEIQLKIDPHASIQKAIEREEGDKGLLDFQTRYNSRGKIAYKTEKSGVGRNGKPWRRLGLVMFDQHASIKVEGWDNLWPELYHILKPGDDIIVVNGSLDAWAVQHTIVMESGTMIHLIQDNG